MNRIIVAVVALAVGCGKQKEACKTEVAELMQFLRSFDHEGSAVYVSDDSHLVQRTGLPKAKQHAPVVVIDAKTMSYQGALVDLQSLTERLVAARDKIHGDIEAGRVPRNDPPDPTLLYFQIDSDVTWDRVIAPVLAGAEAGFTRPLFVFTMPMTAKPPPRTWVDDKFDELRKNNGRDGGGLATGLASITQGIVKSCPAIKKVYGAVGADEGGDKAAMLIEGTGPALIECNCDVDMAALRSVWWMIMGDPHPSGALAIEIAKDGTPVELAAATAWSDASKRLAPGTKIWLVSK